MDPLFLAMSFYRRRKFEECAEVCTQLLKKNPYDQVVHFRGNQKKVPLIAAPNLKQSYTNMLLIFFSVLRKSSVMNVFSSLIRRHGV